MRDLTATLWEMMAYVDQLAAEYKDPETPILRKIELRVQLQSLYEVLKEFDDHN